MTDRGNGEKDECRMSVRLAAAWRQSSELTTQSLHWAIRFIAIPVMHACKDLFRFLLNVPRI